MPHGPDIGGVVGARGGGDGGILEEAFLDRELLIHVGGHEHDVHQALVHDFADDVEEFGQIAVAVFFARPDFGRELRGPRAVAGEVAARAGGAHAERHVGVLGIGKDEIPVGPGGGVDGRQFLVKGADHVMDWSG